MTSPTPSPIRLADRIASVFGWKSGCIPNTELAAVQINSSWVALPHLSYGFWPPHLQNQQLPWKQLLSPGVQWRWTGEEKSFKTASWLYLNRYKPKTALLKKLGQIKQDAFRLELGGQALLQTFWLVYAKRLHELGSLPLPQAFFSALLDGFQEGHAEIFVLYHEDKPVGAAYNLAIGGFYENAWFATLKKYQGLGTSYFMHEKMIEHAKTAGFEIYSFGRSTTGEGVHQFKRQWGTVDVPLAWYQDGLKKEGKWLLAKTAPLIRLLPFSLVVFLGKLTAKFIY